MKKLSIIIISIISVLTVNAQVRTIFSPEKSVLETVKVIKDNKKAKLAKKFMPFDVQKRLDEDAANKGLDIPFRFGEGFDSDITLSDGNWTKVENGRLWSMEFESEGAYSINFVFNDFYLPEGAELYIANREETMLYGPVTSKQNTKNGFFLTDLVQGDNVTLHLFEPADKQGQARLTIKRVVHAYKKLFANFLYGGNGTSESCNNNIDNFPAWDLESDAVALVLLSNGIECCSGSLLMTANQTFRPFFLTAFHCIDVNLSADLSAAEISDAENWMFKFQYKQSTYTGNSRTSGITYNGAEFRAAWNNTDFALMEMDDSPAGDARFSWLGWDRSGNTSTSGTGIHHPAGDVMKISFEENPFQVSSWGGTNNHWFLNFDNGVVQPGSSGSPILNQDRRVVGQLHGTRIYNGSLSYCAQPRADYGRFNLSWTGGGTNTTRLSNWLDPSGSGVMTTNTSRFPTLTGPTFLCFTGTFKIENLPAGCTVEWSSGNSNFTVSSSSGNSAVFTAKAYNASGTVVATVRRNGAAVLTLNRAISSCELEIDANNQGYFYSLSCRPHRFSIPLLAGTSVSWEYPQTVTVENQGDNYIELIRGETPAGDYILKATVTDNTTGRVIATSQQNIPVYDIESIYISTEPSDGRGLGLHVHINSGILWRVNIKMLIFVRYGINPSTIRGDLGLLSQAPESVQIQ